MAKQRTVFISYAREDSDWAARLVNELQARGIKTWFDRENLLPGQDWDMELGKAIEECRYFLALLSHHSVNKQGVVQREVKKALSLRDNHPPGSAYILPVRIDDCNPAHPDLKRLQWLDLFDDWEYGIRRLLKVISEDGLAESPEADIRFKQSLGRFRHAILGPVQGLISAARLLVSVAHEAGADPSVTKRLANRIDQEAETIRLWRENQAVYLRTVPSLVFRSQLLRPTVERTTERFRSILSEREIGLTVLWRTAPQLTCCYDSGALDLIISNLLDNARKYSFYNQEVVLGVEKEGATIRVWVEDTGHRLPEDMLAAGTPAVLKVISLDSAMHGEGLGLKVVRSLATAHGGDLFYECWAVAEGKTVETTPHKVRFVVTLKCVEREAEGREASSS